MAKSVIIIEKAANGYIMSSPATAAKVVAVDDRSAMEELAGQLVAQLNQNVIPQPGMRAVIEIEAKPLEENA